MSHVHQYFLSLHIALLASEYLAADPHIYIYIWITFSGSELLDVDIKQCF